MGEGLMDTLVCEAYHCTFTFFSATRKPTCYWPFVSSSLLPSLYPHPCAPNPHPLLSFPSFSLMSNDTHIHCLVVQGVRRPPLPDYLEVKRCFAVHECGKALVAIKLREKTGRLEEVERVSIVPRGRSAAHIG